MKLILNIITTLFYALGYGCFFIVSVDMDTRHQKAYYSMMIPFMIVLMLLVLFKIYVIWR